MAQLPSCDQPPVVQNFPVRGQLLEERVWNFGGLELGMIPLGNSMQAGFTEFLKLL